MDRTRPPYKHSLDQFSNMYDDRVENNHHSSQGYEYQDSYKGRSPGRDTRAINNSMRPGPDRFDDRTTDSNEGRYAELSPPRDSRVDGRGRYASRDQEGYKSPDGRSRSRSRSRSRTRNFGSSPNCTVILEGLPLGMSQEDILNELQSSLRVEGIREIRLIKDKRTGASRQFAFAQFASTREAFIFLEKYHPAVPLYGAYDPNTATESEAVKVRISFSREKEDRTKAGESGDDWKCDVCYLANYPHRTLCFRCNAPRTRATAHGMIVAQAPIAQLPGFIATGDSDVSPDSTASQFLLLRGLEPGVTEELLYKGVSKLYRAKAGQSTTDSQMGKKKISSTSKDTSLGARDGSLRRVLLIRDKRSNDSWRYGFAEYDSVEDAQAAMAKYKASDRFTISSKPVVVSYIHAGVFVPVLHDVDPEFDRFTFSPLANATIKLMYWDEAAFASEFVNAIVQQPSATKLRETEHAKLAVAAAHEGLVPIGKEGETKSKKRKSEKIVETPNKKVVAPHLQFWTNRHAELHGLPSKDDKELKQGSILVAAEKSSDDPPSQTFADIERKCCLLCSRQFKTDAEVNKHERVSQLHRENMKDEDLVAKALLKLNRAQQDGPDSATYRDRARERRQAFNQPKQPAAQNNRGTRDANQTQSPPKVPAEEHVPVPSRGATLLGKMGWTTGEGLGAKGTGRTEAITTELYSKGVGIGAEGGKMGDAVEEAHRQTKSTYADFLNKTKDKAKERFESMG